jgi:hypothetical protein
VSKHLYSETGKGLSSSGSDDASNDQLKSTIANGKMQQWFREGVAGIHKLPMLLILSLRLGEQPFS